MNEPEILKQPETRHDPTPNQTVPLTAAFTFDHFKNLIRQRREKLEKIKAFITLKTFNFINEKIDREELQLKEMVSMKKKEVAKQNIKQSLPKEFFEQHYLKPRNIRID